MCSFLQHLPEDGITLQGATVLREWSQAVVDIVFGHVARQDMLTWYCLSHAGT
jgi:hypothetical protein